MQVARAGETRLHVPLDSRCFDIGEMIAMPHLYVGNGRHIMRGKEEIVPGNINKHGAEELKVVPDNKPISCYSTYAQAQENGCKAVLTIDIFARAPVEVAFIESRKGYSGVRRCSINAENDWMA